MPTLVELFEAGVHFGHKKERSHPKAKEFIYTLRDGVYVIDLEKTISHFDEALKFLKNQIAEGKIILFVGTKRQAKELVKEVAASVGMPYIVQRWLGGFLTNFETVQKSINELDRLENQVKSPEFEALTKKEQKVINDKVAKLLGIFEGVRTMKRLPDAVFVLDAKREELAVSEAHRMNIPVVATCDTDANPEKVDYVIPANDDAVKSITLVLNTLKEALMTGQGVKVEKSDKDIEIKKEDKEIVKKAETKKEVKKAMPTGRQEIKKTVPTGRQAKEKK